MSEFQKIKNTGNLKNRGITRRDFLKYTAAAGAAGTLVDWAVVGPKPALAAQADYVVRNICPYCSVGCGVRIAVQDPDSTPFSGDETVIDIYGDEDHIISRGRLCSKGAALLQLVNSPERVLEPRIKVNGVWYTHEDGAEAGWKDIFGVTNWTDTSYSATVTSSKWKDSSGTALSVSVDTIPEAMRKTRNVSPGNPDSVAFWGSSHLTNEECYLYRKLITIYGTHNIEHQARI
jgi:formate dehydrogenase major subunit